MLLKDLELANVEYQDEGKKVVLTFLDKEREEIREVNFNKQVYDKDKNEFIPSTEKSEEVEKWCQEYFELPFDRLAEAIGVVKDVYAYDKFNSLWESKQVAKFNDDMVGQLITGTVTEIEVDDIGIKIYFDYTDDDNTLNYISKMTYSDYIETLGKWFVNPQRKVKQLAKFESKFHVPADDADSLIGTDILVEVKKAMGKYIYNEIKPLPKKKSK